MIHSDANSNLDKYFMNIPNIILNKFIYPVILFKKKLLTERVVVGSEASPKKSGDRLIASVSDNSVTKYIDANNCAGKNGVKNIYFKNNIM